MKKGFIQISPTPKYSTTIYLEHPLITEHFYRLPGDRQEVTRTNGNVIYELIRRGDIPELDPKSIIKITPTGWYYKQPI